MAKIHRLKTWPDYFQAVKYERKTFEIREDDRGFETGDYLVLDEWSPSTGYTKEEPVVRIVTYLLRGGQFGVEAGHVVLGLDKLAEKAASFTILDVAPPRATPPITEESIK